MGRHILEDNPYLHQIHYYNEADGVLSQLSLWQKLRTECYDVVIDFMNNPRSGLMTFFSGGKKRISFKSKRSIFYNHLEEHDDKVNYIVREKFRLLRPLGLEAQKVGLTLPWFDNHTAVLKEFLAKNESFANANRRVFLSPTHRRPIRKWPAGRYAELADRLVQDWQAEVVWLWGPGEEEEVRSAQGLCKGRTLLAPKTSFRELAALMANGDLFVGNSNGPSHVAVAVDIPSLQLHGPTDEKAWCPDNAKHRAMTPASRNLGDLSVQQVFDCLENRLKAEVDRQATLRSHPRLIWSEPNF
jgi:ADP-heptose:LPS heptosyltransferase